MVVLLVHYFSVYFFFSLPFFSILDSLAGNRGGRGAPFTHRRQQTYGLFGGHFEPGRNRVRVPITAPHDRHPSTGED